MDVSIESKVADEVDSWLRWLPRWRPGTHRGRSRLCRQCFGSPVVAAAGLAQDVPHAVQHALAMRMKLVVEASVDVYTAANLPLLARELHRGETRRAARPYSPTEGLDPEFAGLDLDPPPETDAPYLFTFAELADAEQAASELSYAIDPARAMSPPPLTPEEKLAIRAELKLADDYASHIGRRLCAELSRHEGRILAGVSEFVEPQVQALLADLDSTLDSPHWPREP